MMLDNLQALFFQKISTKYKNKDVLLVFKGFSFKFLELLAHKISPLNDFSTFTENSLLDLNKLSKKSVKRSIRRNFLNELVSLNFCSYEEFLISDPDIKDLDVEVLFINNDFFQNEIINPTNNIYPDFDKEISSEMGVMDFEDEKFNMVFAHSSINEIGVNYLNYKTLLNTIDRDVKIIGFYAFSLNITEKKLSFQPIPSNQNDIKKLSNSDYKDLTCIFRDIYFDELSQSNQRFIISDNLNESKGVSLRILEALYKKNNLEIIFYRDKTEQEKLKPRKEIKNLLKKHWNSDQFRDVTFYKNPSSGSNKVYTVKQDLICEHIIRECENAQLDKKFNDIFLTAPTGAGKSLFFQIPALYIGKKDLITIVVSPLKALMYDQVESLIHQRKVDNAAYLNSDLSIIERDEVIEGIKNGKFDIVYMSPELLLSYSIDTFIGDRKIGLMAVDEAHLVSTWGRGFRVDYWYLGTHLSKLKRYHCDKDGNQIKFPILALTATAVYGGDDDIALETIDSLNMDPGNNGFYIGSAKREDITLNHYLFNPKGSYKNEKQDKTLDHLKFNVRNNIKTIAYFPFASQVNETWTLLEADSSDDKYHDQVGIFHGKIDDKNLKKETQDKFKNNDISLVLASKAFGMGVDISDIEQVYHHAPSGSLADYVQEIGRAARDKNIQGKAVTFFNDDDMQYSKILFGLSSIKQYQIKWILRKILKIYDNEGKKQNILANSDDFSHIFGDSQKNDNGEIDNKIQSCLMMIEKDFISKRGFPVLIARPKRLFGTVFAKISNLIEPIFVKKYKNYIKLKKESTEETVVTNTDKFGRTTTTTTPGGDDSIYEIHLDRLWEDKFRKENFASLKRSFFNQELFIETEFGEDNENQPIPMQKLSIKFTNKLEKSDLIEKYEMLWEALIAIFSSFDNKYFSAKEFNKALRQELPGLPNSYYTNLEEILTLFKNKPKSEYEWTSHQKALKNTFLQTQKRYDERVVGKFGQNDTQVYRMTKDIYRTKRSYMSKFLELMSTIDYYENSVERYINTGRSKDGIFVKIAQLLEFFDLASFQVIGGENPKIFIRINDPLRLRLTATNEYYKNELAEDVYRRFEASNELMYYFFKSEKNSKEKWQLIEDYFLGKDISDEMKLFNEK